MTAPKRVVGRDLPSPPRGPLGLTRSVGEDRSGRRILSQGLAPLFRLLPQCMNEEANRVREPFEPSPGYTDTARGQTCRTVRTVGCRPPVTTPISAPDDVKCRRVSRRKSSIYWSATVRGDRLSGTTRPGRPESPQNSLSPSPSFHSSFRRKRIFAREKGTGARVAVEDTEGSNDSAPPKRRGTAGWLRCPFEPDSVDLGADDHGRSTGVMYRSTAPFPTRDVLAESRPGR